NGRKPQARHEQDGRQKHENNALAKREGHLVLQGANTVPYSNLSSRITTLEAGCWGRFGGGWGGMYFRSQSRRTARSLSAGQTPGLRPRRCGYTSWASRGVKRGNPKQDAVDACAEGGLASPAGGAECLSF